ncbi:hypothetical protein HPB50_006091 [Hyalomma asiaticum]|uniref:Uncharacterized protein n=1 Tax=Hyalomma asiaticum TaxID=266040 RepID=A0ACB7SW37_HYAAI|nr:hypothetical protein HPB50_006091 [Hyalomma asiaticum]
MAAGLHSYSIVEEPGFLSLMHAAVPEYKVPSRTTFSRSVMPELYAKKKERIKEAASPSSDVWSVFATLAGSNTAPTGSDTLKKEVEEYLHAPVQPRLDNPFLWWKNIGKAKYPSLSKYAHETQHEKILRGLAVGIALVLYGRLEEADAQIDALAKDKDALLRRSAMHAIAMAYCGSGNNRAVRRLLHVAVSDVNDDVRRAAVEALGFILFRTPEQCPGVVSLLSESYNPNVRYGSAMALGISCAGTGNKEALSLLEPMTNDPVNYVRQGALIASALILIQQTEATCPKVKDFRQLYHKVVSDKHDDVMAKLGAILAQGILDAGGRNVTVALTSRTGHVNMAGVVGMLVFTQFWYWFPLAHFLSLALSPTCLVALTGELRMPRLQIRSGAKPSTFAYPPPLEEKKEREREKVTTAVLSITAKARRREAYSGKESPAPAATPDTMEVDEEPSTSAAVAKKEEAPAAATEEAKKEGSDAPASTETKVEPKAEPKADTKADSKTEAKTESKTEVKAKPEPNFELLSNPARVVKPQLKLLTMPEGSRYRPIKDITIGGIIMVTDTKSSEEEELVEPVSAGGPTAENDEGDEPEAPEPFEYPFDHD